MPAGSKEVLRSLPRPLACELLSYLWFFCNTFGQQKKKSTRVNTDTAFNGMIATQSAGCL